MGYSSYSTTSRSVRATEMGYATNSVAQNFKNSKIEDRMNPVNITMRESRDSEEHPCAVPIIIGLDVTGSMGMVPQELCKEGLPTMVSHIIENGNPDPQVMMLAIGDHECDRSPIQAGQFESGDEELDTDLTSFFLEGGGGGNGGESYLLAWYMAANRTETDHWDKRQKKGFLFTIGDEPNLKSLPAGAQEKLFGAGQYSDQTAAELLAAAQERYHVYHIHINHRSYVDNRTISGWKEVLGDNLIEAQGASHVAGIIAGIVNIDNTSGITEVDITEDASITTDENTNPPSLENML